MTVLRVLLLGFIIAALALLIRPDDAVTTAYLVRADELRATYLYRQADDYTRVAALRQPWNAAVQLRLAQLARLQRDFDQAAARLDEAARLGADPIDLSGERGLLAEARGDFAAAAAQWQVIVDARPADRQLPRRLIDAYLRAGDFAAALGAAQRYADRLEDAPLLLGKLQAIDDPAAARLHFEQADSDLARQYLAALDQPEAALRAMLLGRLYLAGGELPLAQRAFEAAVAANPAYAEAHAYTGFVIDEQGGDGAAELDRAAALDADLIVARYFRARHALARGQIDQAMSDLEEAARLDQQNPLIAAELGRAHLLRGELPEAEQWLKRARDARSDDASAWLALAELYAGRIYGPRDQAVSVAQEAVRRAPQTAEAHVWLAAAYLSAGDRGGAERELRRALELNPASAVAYLYLGRLFGRGAEAGQQAYEQALTLDPDGPIGAQARRALELP